MRKQKEGEREKIEIDREKVVDKTHHLSKAKVLQH